MKTKTKIRVGFWALYLFVAVAHFWILYAAYHSNLPQVFRGFLLATAGVWALTCYCWWRLNRFSSALLAAVDFFEVCNESFDNLEGRVRKIRTICGVLTDKVYALPEKATILVEGTHLEFVRPEWRGVEYYLPGIGTGGAVVL